MSIICIYIYIFLCIYIYIFVYIYMYTVFIYSTTGTWNTWVHWQTPCLVQLGRGWSFICTRRVPFIHGKAGMATRQKTCLLHLRIWLLRTSQGFHKTQLLDDYVGGLLQVYYPICPNIFGVDILMIQCFWITAGLYTYLLDAQAIR